MRDFELYCAGCGKLMSYQKAWRCLAGVLICSKECHDKVEIDYCKMILPTRESLKPVS